jgi:hypothetical protein
MLHMLVAVVVLQFLVLLVRQQVWAVVVTAYMVNRGFKHHMVADVLLLMVIMAAVLLEIEQVLGHNMEFMVQVVAVAQEERILEVKEVLV